MKIKKIYVDMDGVLCDFEKRYTERYGEISDQVRRTTFRANFDDFIKTEQFSTLSPMKDAHVLIRFLNTVDVPKEILSSTAYDEVYDTISKQKTEWLSDHNIGWKTNFVPGKRHKYKFATPDSIIIDDTYSVIEDWNKAGGIAIWHKDALSTISQLKMYL
jgi:phosphoglycolate phosphatase-like HAD superfamily hydrolase